MSEDSNKKMSSFLKVNLAVFLFYATIGSILAGSTEIIGFLLPFHLIILAITQIFTFIFGKSAGQGLGYVLLFFLFIAIIGFSICAGSINIH
jgi:hypothetical protein